MSASELSAVQLALAARSARDALRADGDASLLASEPIAIIGMACRFPGGADSPAKLWALLDAGADAVIPVPDTRWDASLMTDDPAQTGKLLTPYAGLLADIEGFDAEFFGIAPREAVRMDPQQRLLLEVTWDALRDAGCSAESLRGSPTGVFAAIYSDDYARNLYGDWDAIDAHTASGNSHGVSAGRIAYLLDLRGPAIAIDTACSSSLVAVHTACRSLRAGETSLAIVGAASLLIAPEQTASLAKWGMMAPDGRTKAFDAAADGWVRGEGAGALVLKRLADALGDGDRVHAVIRGTAINQDGRSAALTAPNGLAQRAVVRAALANARVAASRVTFVEAHGTGTSVGDPIELEALIAELGQASTVPCHVGTVKANLGHLEAAAGVAGILKVVLSLQHERIPPHINFTTLNPLVSLEGTRLRIDTAGTGWQKTRDLRVAGVSSFGFGGTNAHVVIEEAPRILPSPSQADGPWLVTLSAHDPVALQEMIEDIDATAAVHGLRDVAWTLASHDAQRYRVAVVAESAASLSESLRGALTDSPLPAGEDRGVAFVFSGHGSQWAGMGRESMVRDPVFAESMRQSDAIVRSLAGWSPLAVLDADDVASRLDDTSIFQPLLVALQMAQVASWRHSGLHPVAVLGHSVGELTAAQVAGALTQAQVLQLAVTRGRLMQELAPEGAMLAAHGDETVVRRVAAEVGQVIVAGENAPAMLTLSGSPDAIGSCRAALEREGITCHRVRVARAFHSPAMHAAASALAAASAALVPRVPSIPFYSSVTGGLLAGIPLDAAYWERNASQPVRFGVATAALLAAHGCALLEVSPHPVLIAPMLATMGGRAARQPVVCTWRRNLGEHATRLAALGVLWCAGIAMDRVALFGEPGSRISLPPYRWQRRRAWAGAPLPLGRMAAGGPADAPLPGRMTEVPALSSIVFEGLVSANAQIVHEHRVLGRPVVPGAMLVLAALTAAERSRHLLPGAGDAVLGLQDVTLDRALAIEAQADRTVQITISAIGSLLSFDITSRAASASAGTAWTRHASGRIVPVAQMPQAMDHSSPRLRRQEVADPAAIYAELEQGGIVLGAAFRLLESVSTGDGEAVVSLKVGDTVAQSLEHAAMRLDAAMHGLARLAKGNGNEPWVPVSYGAVQLSMPYAIAASRTVLRAGDSGSGTCEADVQLFDAAGSLIGGIVGVRVQRTTRQALARSMAVPEAGNVYSMRWVAAPAAPSATGQRGEQWLVLEASASGVTPIADAIEAAGGVALRVSPPPNAMTLDAATLDTTLGVLFRSALQRNAAELAGVVFAWGLEDTVGTVPLAGSALVLLRELVALGVAPLRGVLLLTRGAVSAAGDAVPGSVAAGALWGLRHTAAAEHSELSLRIVDLSLFGNIADDLPAVLQECHAGSSEPRVARRGTERLVARLALVPTPVPRSAWQSVALLPPEDSLLESIAPKPVPRSAPGRGMLEIEVVAAGLNFRDVLGALGMVALPGNALGGECAGVVSAIGDGVAGVAVGDRVVAFSLGALRTHVCVAADLVAPIPEWMSFEAAGTLPVAYLTAYYALVHVANVQRGERVLVHAAAGGVGMAAVHIAHWRGAEVVGSAGSAEKRAFLRSIGVARNFDSRAVTFREALRGADGGGTINVVLNALSDEFIPASLDVLTPGGRFVEIGKRGIWSTDAVAARRPDVAYTVFDLSSLEPVAAAGLGTMLRDVMCLVRNGELPPLPTATFTLDDCVSAFRFMAQARHTGKIAIVMPAASEILRTDGTYLVTGAFGALGRRVVERLVAEGVRSFALLARRGPDDDASRWLQTLASQGVNCRSFRLDVGDRTALAAALDEVRRDLLPLRGVVHTAGVNDDGALLTQTVKRLADVMQGKVEGALHLDALTRGDALDTFILFSSASGVIGWPGQVTYSAANAALDLVAARRRASGRRALSLQWGTWDGGGMAARVDARVRRFDLTGIRAFTPDHALDLMLSLRTAADDRLLVIRADWQDFVRTRPGEAALTSLLRSVTSVAAAPSAPPAQEASLLDTIAALPESLRADAVREVLMKLAARMLGLPSGARPDMTRPLRDLGLDSLMAVELRNAIGAAVGRTLPATLLFEQPTVEKLAAFLLALIAPLAAADDAMQPLQPAGIGARAAALNEVSSMSEDDAEALLLAELAAPSKPPALR